MSYEHPVLTTGAFSNQSIYQTVTDKRHDVGTRACLPDGRVFYYSANQTTAIGPGLMTKMTEVDANMDDLATDPVGVGEKVINITPITGTTYEANELAGGFVSINSGATGLGQQYRIAGHIAIADATATDIQLSEEVRVAIDATATATLVPNPWSDCQVADADETQFLNGVTPITIPVGTAAAPVYFWNQTWGTATVLADTASTGAIGTGIQAGNAVAGAFDISDGVNQIAGVVLYTAVAADYTQVFLQIAP